MGGTPDEQRDAYQRLQRELMKRQNANADEIRRRAALHNQASGGGGGGGGKSGGCAVVILATVTATAGTYARLRGLA